jgi:hypothetical protein
MFVEMMAFFLALPEKIDPENIGANFLIIHPYGAAYKNSL